MQLQVALDCAELAVALKTMEEVHQYVDIAEIGTPLMFSAGVAAVREVKKNFPRAQVLADMKIMDGGDPIASIAFEAGVDIVTASGVTNDSTIAGVIAAARRFGRKCFVDLISVSDVAGRAAAVDAMGADYVGVHTSYDLRESVATPLEDLKKIKKAMRAAKPAISGGIDLAILETILPLGPEIVIVGGAIMRAQDKAAVARAFREKMDAAAK